MTALLEMPRVASTTASTTTPTRPRRDGSGRRLRPEARPTRTTVGPVGLRGASTRSCADVAPPAVLAPARRTASASGWRLTERGIALVLVVVTMVTVAAVAVIGLTAVRVTADSYQPYGQSALQ